MTTGAFSQNVSKLFSELKLVTNNLFMEQPTEKPLKGMTKVTQNYFHACMRRRMIFRLCMGVS